MTTPSERNGIRNGVRRPAIPVPEPHDWADGERCTHDSHGLGKIVRVETYTVLVDFGEGDNAVRRVKRSDDRLKPL